MRTQCNKLRMIRLCRNASELEHTPCHVIPVCDAKPLLIVKVEKPFDRCVLAAQSFPLRAMFEGAFKEGKEDVITLRDVESSTFALLLDFWYDRSVEITTNNVEALLDLSARYGVSLLRRHCCAFVARSANPSNSFSLLAVADRYDCRRLRKKLLAYTLQAR